MKKINPIIQDYMKKEAISILLDKKNIIMGVNELDITNKLITKINDDLKE